MKKIGVLFPGQGSQYVGMGKKLYERFESVRALFDAADGRPGYRSLNSVSTGPKRSCERPITRSRLSCLRATRSGRCSRKKQVSSRFLLAGHSLGEYTALLASGVFSLEDAVRLTRKRGLLMEEACPAGTGGMVALIAPDLEKVRRSVKRFPMMTTWRALPT